MSKYEWIAGGVVIILVGLIVVVVVSADDGDGITIGYIKSYVTTSHQHNVEIYLSQEEVNNTIYNLGEFMGDGDMDSTFEFKDQKGVSVVIKKSGYWGKYTLEELQQPDDYSELYKSLAVYEGCFLIHEIDKCLVGEPCLEFCQDWLESTALTESGGKGK